jgi:death on curing protein
MEPRWLSRKVVDAIQEDQRQQHGGQRGILNASSIESALGRPRHRFLYERAGLVGCAASYLFGLTKNHGYLDANIRTAYMATLTFLRMNGVQVQAEPEEIIQLMLAVATDQIDEVAIERWLNEHAKSR